jgi:iron(III) transport system ATP-binding protein
MSAPCLALDDVSFAYHRKAAVVEGLSFALAAGEIGCLLGPSGCGKTTVLRLIAGLEAPVAGRILLDGNTVTAPGGGVPAEARGIGMVFQDFALFPHLDVAGNIAFGLSRWTGTERAARVQEMLAAVGLSGQGGRYPHQLSGGQKQRVALARALAARPRLILMDEPFSSLDAELREQLSLEVRSVLRAARATALLVTHDQHEAFAMADWVGVMRAGQIEQWDTPYNVYHRPANRFVADFVGQGVFLPGTVDDGDGIVTELGRFRHCPGCGLHPGDAVEVLLRPDDLVHDDASPVLAEVLGKAFRGAEFLYTVRLPSGRTALSLVPSHHNHALGERIGVRTEVDHVVAFRPGT